MARIIHLTTPEFGVTNGMQLSFEAPCDCTDVTAIELGGIEYEIIDTSGQPLTSCSGYFKQGAILTGIFNLNNEQVTILNPRVNTYTKSLGTPEDEASASGGTVWARVKNIEDSLSGVALDKHTHKKSDITDFAHNHDERYYTEDEINIKLTNLSVENIVDFPESMPASDVYDWAKNPRKPAYLPLEIGAASLNHKHTEIAEHEERLAEVEEWKSTVEASGGIVAKELEINVNSASDTTYTNVEFETNRVYAIHVKVKSTDNFSRTMLIFPDGSTTNYSTISSDGSYCLYNYTGSQWNLIYCKSDGSAQTVHSISWRAI